MSSLKEMLSLLQHLERIQDNSEEITQQMVQDHFDAIKEVDAKVDNLYNFMAMCKANAAMYSERAEAYDKKSERFESLYFKCEQYIMYLLERFPEVEWRGNDVQFKRRLNPHSLQCPFTKSQSLSNVIPDDMVSQIPEQYRKKKQIWILQADMVKDDLKLGKSVDFASLVQKPKLVTDFKISEDRHENKRTNK